MATLVLEIVGLGLVPYTIPRWKFAPSPPLISPPNVAEVGVIELAVVVVMVGAVLCAFTMLSKSSKLTFVSINLLAMNENQKPSPSQSPSQNPQPLIEEKRGRTNPSPPRTNPSSTPKK